MNYILSLLNRSSFVRDTFLLLGGSFFAQLIIVSCSPVIARLYTPSQFGLAGTILSIVSVLSAFATLKYELSIVLPKSNVKAGDLFSIANIFLFIVSLCFLVFTIFLLLIEYASDMKPLGISENMIVLLFIPPLLVVTGMFNTYSYWNIRNKEFKNISIAQISRSLGIVLVQILSVIVFKIGMLGLLIAQFIGNSTAILVLNFSSKKNPSIFRTLIKFRSRMLGVGVEYKRFPIYTAPQSLINSISQNIPTLMLALFFDSYVAGYYFFSFRLLQLPNNLVNQSLRRVYYREANERYNNQKGIFDIHFKSTKLLFFIGILPFFCCLFFGPFFFSLVFGENWLEAGRYLQWLIIWWIAMFINPPSIMTLHIMGKQKFLFINEILFTSLRLIGIAIGGYYDSPMLSIMLFSIFGFLYNFFVVSVAHFYSYKKNIYLSLDNSLNKDI